MCLQEGIVSGWFCSQKWLLSWKYLRMDIAIGTVQKRVRQSSFSNILFLICGSVNDAISSSYYMALNCRMINELERMRKEAVVVYFEVLSQHSLGRTEEDHEIIYSGWLVIRPRFEPSTLRMQFISVTDLVTSPIINRMMKSRRMRWAGQVALMGEKKNAYRILVWKPERKRPLGRPRRRWKDNIKMDLRRIGWGGKDWIDLAQDRNHWKALVNTVINLGVP
jgi:hypothetical protein